LADRSGVQEVNSNPIGQEIATLWEGMKPDSYPNYGGKEEKRGKGGTEQPPPVYTLSNALEEQRDGRSRSLEKKGVPGRG